MARRSLFEEDEATRIDLSPMIDCIFILLIFFIVATVFVEEKGLQANKPDAAAPTTVEKNESVILRITAENKIFLDQQEIALADVAGRVQAMVQNEETPVVIRAHELSDHGTFVSVWDAARRGGAGGPHFRTAN